MPLSPHIAIVTPFQNDGKVDLTALQKYLDFLLRQRITRIVVGGTTGEFFSQTAQERLALLRHVRLRWPHTIVFNVSAPALGDVQFLLRDAHKFADAMLVLPPSFYAGAPEAGLFEYFDLVMASTKAPTWLYDFPRHSNNPLTPDIVRKLAEERKHFVGIKSSHTLDSALTLKAAAPRLNVVLGNDTLALAGLEAGLDGSVSGGSNPVAALLDELYQSRFQAGGGGPEIQARIDTWATQLGTWGTKHGWQEIPVIKVAMSALLPGFPTFVRAPLCPVPDADHAEIIEAVTALASSVTRN